MEAAISVSKKTWIWRIEERTVPDSEGICLWKRCITNGIWKISLLRMFTLGV